MPMAREKEQQYEAIRKSLTQLDLHHHSLKRVGRKLATEAAKPSVASSGALYEQSLQLGKGSTKIIHDLCQRLSEEDLDSCESALNRVDLAIRRASQAKSPTLCMVNVWRVIEATEQLLTGIAHKYDYVRLSEEAALEVPEGEETKAAELDKLFEEYEEVMATKIGIPKPAGPPFSHGILHWRGSQLFYVERIEDGARWIELDPDYERQGSVYEEEAAEIVRARTIEGYPITLSLDLMVDENEIDNYLVSQIGAEYFVSGAQIAEEGEKRRGRKGHRG